MSSRTFARACALSLACVASCLPGAIAATPFGANYGPENYTADLGHLQQAIDDFHTKETTAKLNDSVAVTRYVQSGMTMSNIACDMWLVSLGRTDRDTTFFKDILNIVGNLILGISGINGAASSSLARGNLFLGAANAGVDAYRSDFLMGVISDIEVKIKSGRAIAEQTLLDNMPGDVDIAKRRLLEYHDTCTPTAIKQLLKTSLQNVAYARPDTSLTDPVKEARASVMASDLTEQIYPGSGVAATISSDDLYRLWVAKIGAPADTTSTIVANYKKASDIVKLDNDFKLKDKEGHLTMVLKQIGELRNYPKRLRGELDKEADARHDDQVQKAQADVAIAAKATEDAQKAVAASQSDLNKAATAAAVASKSADKDAKANATHVLSTLSAHPALMQGQDPGPGTAALLSQPGEHSMGMSTAVADLARDQARLAAAKSTEDEARRARATLLSKQRSSHVNAGASSITPIIAPLGRP
jgi:hypothetical protein